MNRHCASCLHTKWCVNSSRINNKKVYHNYIDKLTDWKDIIEDIYYISSYAQREVNNELKEYLLGSEMYYFLKNLEQSIIIYFKNNPPNKHIYTHYNITFDIIKGELDFMVDDHLFEIKSSLYQTTTLSNVMQSLIYGYLVKKKDIIINKVTILNPLLGTITTFNTKDFNFNTLISSIYFFSKYKS